MNGDHKHTGQKALAADMLEFARRLLIEHGRYSVIGGGDSCGDGIAAFDDLGWDAAWGSAFPRHTPKTTRFTEDLRPCRLAE